MITSRITPLLLCTTLAALAAPAIAQNIALEPSFGTIALETGFLPDPTIVDVRAGGSNLISTTDTVTGGTCEGYVADAPDARLHFTAGDELPLTFFAESAADTILLVNAPDGTWHCTDDARGLDPAMMFETPQSGQYDIWVGTYAPTPDGFPEAALGITEYMPFAGQPGTARTFFGQDDRKVVDASAAPWNMIGMVEMENGLCTGTLVAPDIVLTAAHCIAEMGEIDNEPLAFYAGYQQQTYVAASTIAGYHVPNAWLEAEANGSDYAFLVLDEPIGETLGYMAIEPLTDAEVGAAIAGEGPTIQQAGYSYDMTGHLTANLNCPILEVTTDGRISHQCDTLQGDSGSPLFIQTADGFRIIGVESHVLFAPELEFDLNVAMDVVEIELAFAELLGSPEYARTETPSKK